MRAYVFSGGKWDVSNLKARNLSLQKDDYVVAADSGLSQALELDWNIDAAVGDMDSVSPDLLSKAEASGIPIHRHPPDKDASDLELAIDMALEQNPASLFILGTLGGRTDFAAAVLSMAGHPGLTGLELEFYLDHSRAVLLGDKNIRARLSGKTGDIVSLLPFPFGSSAKGIHTKGLKWALQGDALKPASTLGVSNEMIRDEAEVWLKGAGKAQLLVIHQFLEL